MDEAKQRQEAARETWQWRAICALAEPDCWIPSLYGAILIAALGKNNTRKVPRVSGGHVDRGGVVRCHLIDREGRLVVDHPIAISKEDYQNAWRVLADRLKFTDAERKELFYAIANWIQRDMRPEKQAQQVLK